MKRIAIGAALGGLAVYLYDPELGENRRGRLSSLWRENRHGVLQAGRSAGERIDSALPLARRIGKTIRRGDWPLVIDRRRSPAAVPTFIAAAAAGGAVVYFMDAVEGSARRRQAIEAGRRALGQVAEMVKPLRGHIGDEPTNAPERIKSRVG
jgi:hypothetical protein